MTVKEAFEKFRSRLELTENEQNDAINRREEVKSVIDEKFAVDRIFLTGSYGRHTKTKPLKDVDIFFVLNSTKEDYLSKGEPGRLLDDVRKVLIDEFSVANVPSPNRRSVTVNFSLQNTDDRVLSIDVVPAFAHESHYIIPDTTSSDGWTHTDPEIHAELATAANKDLNGKWKPLIKMIKKWNEQNDKPIKPSFLIEVIGLGIIHGPFSELGYPYEIRAFFATAEDRIYDEWPDPANLGQPVSDRMTKSLCDQAKIKFREVGKHIDQAIRFEREGSDSKALRVWRDNVFGDLFPLS